VHSSASRPILLILDEHCSHKDLKVIEYARDNHVHMLSTLPRTTHKLQPLDWVFFKHFKQAYGSASASWMRQNPGAWLMEYDVAGLVNTAFIKVTRL
jgi:REP element-mobilizing transposase RayT